MQEFSVVNLSALIVAIDDYVVIVIGRSCSLPLQSSFLAVAKIQYTFSYITSFSIS